MQYNFILIFLGLIAIQTHETRAASVDHVQSIINFGKSLIYNDDDQDTEDGEEEE
jgi:hypothetical protein